MRVWEDMKQESPEEARDMMFENRTSPCDIELQSSHIGREKLQELCREFEQDCGKCTNKYVECEVR